MLSNALIRQYANSARVSPEVAGQDIALHYALALLNEHGLLGRPPGASAPGPLLFKGGTALRKCVFGSLGRFSEDIDLDAERKNGFEAEIEGRLPRPALPLRQDPLLQRGKLQRYGRIRPRARPGHVRAADLLPHDDRPTDCGPSARSHPLSSTGRVRHSSTAWA